MVHFPDEDRGKYGKKARTVSMPGFFVSPERIFKRVVNGTFDFAAIERS